MKTIDHIDHENHQFASWVKMHNSPVLKNPWWKLVHGFVMLAGISANIYFEWEAYPLAISLLFGFMSVIVCAIIDTTSRNVHSRRQSAHSPSRLEERCDPHFQEAALTSTSDDLLS